MKIIIPARLESSRLYRKALQYIGDTPMVVKTAKSCKYPAIVATDSKDIDKHCTVNGIPTVMTSEMIRSGTDRVNAAAEALELEDNEIIINVQGDYPFLRTKDIEDLAISAEEGPDGMYTLVKPIGKDNDHVVKAFVNRKMEAIDFSRTKKSELEHVGIYAYKYKILKSFCAYGQSHRELKENIEHLRALENNIKVFCLHTDYSYIGVNTPEDLRAAQWRAFNVDTRI